MFKAYLPGATYALAAAKLSEMFLELDGKMLPLGEAGDEQTWRIAGSLIATTQWSEEDGCWYVTEVWTRLDDDGGIARIRMRVEL